jgi:uncharacterized protein
MDIMRFNPWVTAAVVAWLIAQLAKVAIDVLIRRKVDFAKLVETGGMPSSHTALVSSLSTAVGLTHGIHSATFAVTLIFSLIVLYDATNLRRNAGHHATYLNEIVEQLLHGEVLKHQEFTFGRLKELLGHNPVEVLVGAFLGIATALLLHQWLGFPAV